MSAWWKGLSLLGQIFATIAVPATIIMIIQSLMMLLGLGFDSDVDIDISDDLDVADASDGLSLITVRGLVAFFSVGGWSGLAATTGGLSPAVSIIIAAVAGTLSLFFIAYLFKVSLKLQSSGNLQIENSVGKTGKVYIPIPANKSGCGQITILVQERLVELSAVTNDDRTLKTGELVVVSEIIDEQTVLVNGQNNVDIKNQKQGGISKWIQN